MKLFFHSVFCVGLSLFIAHRFFPLEPELAAACFISLGMIIPMKALLDKNRVGIWEEKRPPWEVNRELAAEITLMFAGFFIAAFFLQSTLPDLFQVSGLKMGTLFKNEFSSLLHHNATVLVGGFVVSVLYREGGLMLILSWNALNWAENIQLALFSVYQTQGLLLASLSTCVLLPHLLCEVVSYSLAGMAGVFFSTALFKYRLTSAEFHKVSRACVALLGVSLVVLLLAVVAEIYLAQPSLHLSS